MREEGGGVKKRIVSRDCNWHAVTLAYPICFEALAQFTSNLQCAGAQSFCFPMTDGRTLLVSWKRPPNAD